MKNFCAEKLNFGLLPKYIARLGSWARRWARLLGAAAGAGAPGAGLAGRWARGLGARAGLGLCTRCTRPIFGSVRLGIFLSQNFWTLFVNPVHEHCSSRIFSKKKNIFKI